MTGEFIWMMNRIRHVLSVMNGPGHGPRAGWPVPLFELSRASRAGWRGSARNAGPSHAANAIPSPRIRDPWMLDAGPTATGLIFAARASRVGEAGATNDPTIQMRTSNVEGQAGYGIHRGLVLPVFLSSGGMFLASYIWHGVVLNDLSELGSDRTPYLLLSALGYVLLGVLLTFLGRYLIQAGVIEKNAPPITHAALMGLVAGIMLGVAVHAMALPARGRFDSLHMLVDMAWQVAEQGVGGALAGIGIFFHAVRLRLEREGAL